MRLSLGSAAILSVISSDRASRWSAETISFTTPYAAKNVQAGYLLLLVARGGSRTETGGSGATLSIIQSIPLVVDMIDANRRTPGVRYADRFNKDVSW